MSLWEHPRVRERYRGDCTYVKGIIAKMNATDAQIQKLCASAKNISNRSSKPWNRPPGGQAGARSKAVHQGRDRCGERRGSRCSPGRIRTARMEHCRRSARGGIARRHAGGAAGRHGGAAQGAEARRVRPSCSKVSAVGVAGEGSRRLPLPGGCRARGGARPSGGDRTRVGDRGRRRSSARAGPGSVSSRRRLCTGVRRIVEFRQTSYTFRRPRRTISAKARAGRTG